MEGRLRVFMNYGTGTAVASPEVKVSDSSKHHVDITWDPEVRLSATLMLADVYERLDLACGLELLVFCPSDLKIYHMKPPAAVYFDRWLTAGYQRF